jgi:hypothetical protein
MLNKWNLLSIYTRMILLTAVFFICYGYLCRLLSIYFFWESLLIGWELLLLGIALLLLDLIRIRRQAGSKATPLKIGLGLVCFMALIQVIGFFVISKSGSLVAAKEFLRSDKSVQLKVGVPQSFVVIPVGGLSQSGTGAAAEGSAEIHLLVKGSTGIMDAVLLVVKEKDKEWKVVASQ